MTKQPPKKQKVLPQPLKHGSRASPDVPLGVEKKSAVRPVNKKELAALWRKDPRQVGRWVEEGMPHTKETTGQREVLFDVCDVTEWRINRELDKKFGEMEKIKLKTAKNNSEMLELQLRRYKEEIIEVAQMEDYLFPIFHNFRAKILALPHALAHVVAGLKDVVEIETTLKERLHQALEELANYDIKQLVAGRGIAKRRAVGSTAADPESKPVG